MNELERAYRAAERRREVPFETRVFRGKVGVLLAVQLSTLLAAVTFAVDMRRLQTPVGVAQAWTEATVFGDCTRFLQLSVAPPDDPERRTRAELCAALRTRTLAARTRLPTTSVTTRLVREGEERAVVEAVVADGTRTTTAALPLVRQGSGWAVVRDLEACRVGCP